MDGDMNMNCAEFSTEDGGGHVPSNSSSYSQAGGGVSSSRQEQEDLELKVEPEFILQQLKIPEHVQAKLDKLERENYYLKKLLSLQLDSDLKGQRPRKRVRNSNGANSYEGSFEDEQGQRFPDAVLCRMLKYINDQKTLLNCRLVCNQWNDTIIDTGELIERINFPVWHPKLFLGLQVANKVKSIVFKHSFPANLPYMATFLDWISKTVRKVTFGYELDENSILNQQKNFLKVLEKCTELRELIITGSNLELIKGCRESTPQIAATNTIKKFSIRTDNWTNATAAAADCAGLFEILYKLPNLAVIEIIMGNTCNNVSPAILKAVWDYLVIYPATLKELRISGLKTDRNASINNFILKIALLAGKNGTNLEFPAVDLNSLTEFEATTDEELSDISSARAIKIGMLTFAGNQLRNLKRLENCTNLEKFYLRFERSLIPGEVNFLKHLPNLPHLGLTSSDNFRLDWKSIGQLDSILSGRLPSIKQVEILGNMLDSLRVFLWPRYFPNLERLALCSMKIPLSDLFVVLSSLEKLNTIQLVDLPELGNDAFITASSSTTTTMCNKNGNGNDSNDTDELPAAITTFKSLTALLIKNCPRLTNRCITHGLSKSITLRKLFIGGNTNIKEDILKNLPFKIVRLPSI